MFLIGVPRGIELKIRMVDFLTGMPGPPTRPLYSNQLQGK